MARHAQSFPTGTTPPYPTGIPNGESVIIGGQIKIAVDGYWQSAPGGAGAYRGEWGPTVSYSANDMVSRDGALYSTWFDQGVNTKFEPTWWTVVAHIQKPRGVFDPEILNGYRPGDTAQEAGVLYRRRGYQQETEAAPSTNPTGSVSIAESGGIGDGRTLPVGTTYTHVFFNMSGGTDIVTGLSLSRDSDSTLDWDASSVFLVVLQTDWYAAVDGTGPGTLVSDIPVLATGSLVGPDIDGSDPTARTWVTIAFDEGVVDLNYKQIVVITDRELYFQNAGVEHQVALSLGGMQFFSSDDMADNTDNIGTFFPMSSSVSIAFTVQEPLWEVLYDPSL